MKPVAPLMILVSLAAGCMHKTEVQAASCSPCDTPFAAPAWGPGTTGRLEASVQADVMLPPVDRVQQGQVAVSLDPDGDGLVKLDLPDCQADLSSLDPNGDRVVDVALVQGAAGSTVAATPGADLDAAKACTMCPQGIEDVMVDVDCTCRGVELTFTTYDLDQLLTLRQLGARLAMDHTVANDAVPIMEGQTIVIKGRTASGQPFVLTDGVAFEDIRHRTYATVVGVRNGVKVIFEPRSDADIGAVQGMGQMFGAQLAQTCDIEV